MLAIEAAHQLQRSELRAIELCLMCGGDPARASCQVSHVNRCMVSSSLQAQAVGGKVAMIRSGFNPFIPKRQHLPDLLSGPASLFHCPLLDPPPLLISPRVRTWTPTDPHSYTIPETFLLLCSSDTFNLTLIRVPCKHVKANHTLLSQRRAQPMEGRHYLGRTGTSIRDKIPKHAD